MRRLSLLPFALLLAGCGGATGSPGAGSDVLVPDRPAPPIVAVDEAPSGLTMGMLGLELGEAPPAAASSSGEDCITWSATGSGGSSSTSGPCSATQSAQLETELKQRDEALRPAPGDGPRVVATLALADGGSVQLVAWKTVAGLPCWEASVQHAGGGGGGGAEGPCTRVGRDSQVQPPCDALCLSSSGSSSDGSDTTFVLAGTVPEQDEAIRVTLDDDTSATYPLTGPLLLDLGDRRIFILELGAHDWRKLELVQGGAVERTVELPETQVAIEDCRAKLGPPPHPTGPATGPGASQVLVQPATDAMNACLQASGAFPALVQPSVTAPSSQARPTTTP